MKDIKKFIKPNLNHTWPILKEFILLFRSTQAYKSIKQDLLTLSINTNII